MKKLNEILKEAIPMEFAGYKGYFTNIERNIAGVERTFKSLIKDLAKDGFKKEVLELQRIYKKYVIELKVNLDNFKRKNT